VLTVGFISGRVIVETMVFRNDGDIQVTLVFLSDGRPLMSLATR